jgi:hypothetical protein
MTAFSRALILAGFVAATGASGALADGTSRDAARAQEPAVQAQNAPVLQEGRSAAVESYLQKRNDRNVVTERRSSEANK